MEQTKKIPTKFWIITFSHKHGVDVWPLWTDEEPSEADIIKELEDAESLNEGEIERIDTYIDITGPFYVPGYEPVEKKDAPADDGRADVESKVLEYIRDNIKGGVRVTNIESMFQEIGVSTSDPLYTEKEKIVAGLIREGQLTTWTEPWRDYCWLIPKDFDHIGMFPRTQATVRCEPFGYGMDGPWETPPCPNCRVNKLENWDDDECAYCMEARSEGRHTPGSTGP